MNKIALDEYYEEKKSRKKILKIHIENNKIINLDLDHLKLTNNKTFHARKLFGLKLETLDLSKIELFAKINIKSRKKLTYRRNLRF